VTVNLQATKLVYVMAYPISGFPLYPLSSKRARANLSHGARARYSPSGIIADGRTLANLSARLCGPTVGLRRARFCNEMHVYNLTRHSDFCLECWQGTAGRYPRQRE
jgi:hypothetical protein